MDAEIRIAQGCFVFSQRNTLQTDSSAFVGRQPCIISRGRKSCLLVSATAGSVDDAGLFAYKEYGTMAMSQGIRYRLMRQIAERDGGWHCDYCGHLLMPIDERDKHKVHYHHEGKYLSYGYRLPPGLKWPTLDHKVPQIKGGEDQLHNLVLCCQSCNTIKREKYSYSEFKAIAQGIPV